MKTYEVQVTYEIQIDAKDEEQALELAETEFCQLVLADNPTSEVFHFEVVDTEEE